MGNKKHTPEPWETVVHASGNPTLIQANGNHLAECWSLDNAIDSAANAARIVDCVNACAGFTNEELETLGHFKAMYETIAAENEQLKAERDKLKLLLETASEALYDIKNWDDELEEEWDDPGTRANVAYSYIQQYDRMFPAAKPHVKQDESSTSTRP